MSLMSVSSSVGSVRSPLSVGVFAGNDILRFGIAALLAQLPQVNVEQLKRAPHDTHQLLVESNLAVLVVACDGLDLPVIERIADDVSSSAAKLLLVVRRTRPDLLDFVAAVPTSGFLIQEDLNTEILLEGLDRTIAGKAQIPDTIASALLDRARTQVAGAQAPRVALTFRERQVLNLLADGLSNKQIAHRVHISEHGVKRVVANLLTKLDCPNRTLVVAVALRQGIIQRQAV